MDSIQAQRIAAIRAKNPKQQVASSPIEHDNKQKDIVDGDKKSINALKWAGIIAAGALAVGGVAHAVRSGKFSKIQDFTSIVDTEGNKINKIGDKVLTWKDGVAFLDGKKASGLIKYKNPKGTIITLRDGVRLSTVNKEKGFNCIFDRLGRLTNKTVNVDGNKVSTVYKYDKNGLYKTITGDTETIFKYDKDGKFQKRLINGVETPFEDVGLKAKKAQTSVSENVADSAKVEQKLKPEIQEQSKVEVSEEPKIETKEAPKADEISNAEVKQQPKTEVKDTPEAEVNENLKPEVQENPKVQEQPKAEVQNEAKVDEAPKLQQEQPEILSVEERLKLADERSGDINQRIRSMKQNGVELEYRKGAVKRLKNEVKSDTVKAMSDEQIQKLLATDKTNHLDFKQLEKEFTLDELKKYSISSSGDDMPAVRLASIKLNAQANNDIVIPEKVGFLSKIKKFFTKKK